MKIGIMTCWQSDDNYGQQMQMFALQHYLRSQGHDAYLIRFSPKNASKMQSIKAGIKQPIKNVVKHFSKALREKMQLETDLKQLSELNRRQNKKRSFDEFRSKFINMTDKIYRSSKELISNPPIADAYITGSDQVWYDPLTQPKAQCFFLQFGSNKALRLSYAASIGRELNIEELPLFTKWLSSFSAISVREESAQQQCFKVGYKETKLCIDPTLLLPVEYYSRIECQSALQHHNNYLFMYILNISSSEEIAWNRVKMYIEDKGLELKTVASSGYEPARELIPNNNNILATIPDWLRLIKNANCVVTTSFHGVVFSILYHRPFLAVLLTNEHSKANTRFLNLLGQLGLMDRIYDSNKSFDIQIDAEIDWKSVDSKIEKLSEEGKSYLCNSLNK